MPQKFAVFPFCCPESFLTLVKKKEGIFDISGFRRSVVEAFALLGC
jgi:hypothetical protein